jgi:transcription elongation factor S-II
MNRVTGLSLLVDIFGEDFAAACDSVLAESPESYNFKCLQLCQQPHVILKLKSGEMTPDELRTDVEQWDPIEWELVLLKQQMQIQSVVEMDASKSVFTIYTCKKCKNNKTTIRYLQTRCGDEPPSIFVTCVECGFEWRRS